MKFVKPYLILTTLVWLPWGVFCIFNLQGIESIIGVNAVNGNGQSDIRAMYGGVQTAIGLMAVLALFDRRYFPNLVFTLAIVGSCLALSRSYGLVVDGSATAYTFGVLGFEAFAGVSGILWLRVLSRQV